MGFIDIFRGREPTTDMAKGKPNNANIIKMITIGGGGYYAWDGKLYHSDIVRACMRPKVKAIGKMAAKHIKQTDDGKMINAEPRIRFLLEEPNPFMTGQKFREKMEAYLMLNNNAFALIIRDENGLPESLYPIPCIMVEAFYNKQSELFLRFTYKNGQQGTFPYTDILHMRNDFLDDEVFGESQAEALTPLMECIGVIDQGISKAVKNSNVIRWLLEFNSSMRPEDIKKQTHEFAESYLSYETESFGVAAVDQKVNAKQVQPTDVIPNAPVSDRITDRIYSFFNTNKKIVQSSFTEDEWTSYYEAEIMPDCIQLSEVFTQRLFSRRERVLGNSIVFESANLSYASMNTKLHLTDFLDRGIMNANEIRELLSLSAIPGGDEYVRRLDTAPIGSTGSTPSEPLDDEGKEVKEEKVTVTENDGEKGGVEDGKNRRKRTNRSE